MTVTSCMMRLKCKYNAANNEGENSDTKWCHFLRPSPHILDVLISVACKRRFSSAPLRRMSPCRLHRGLCCSCWHAGLPVLLLLLLLSSPHPCSLLHASHVSTYVRRLAGQTRCPINPQLSGRHVVSQSLVLCYLYMHLLCHIERAFARHLWLAPVYSSDLIGFTNCDRRSVV